MTLQRLKYNQRNTLKYTLASAGVPRTLAEMPNDPVVLGGTKVLVTLDSDQELIAHFCHTDWVAEEYEAREVGRHGELDSVPRLVYACDEPIVDKKYNVHAVLTRDTDDTGFLLIILAFSDAEAIGDEMIRIDDNDFMERVEADALLAACA